MEKSRLNCWDFMRCGRQLGGHHVSDLGICPATQETRLDSVHGGHNAGRSCWVLTGTLCKGEVQGTFARKFKSCQICDFYQMVKKEESHNFQLSAVLVKKITKS